MLKSSGGDFWLIPTTLLSILAYGSKKILLWIHAPTKICDTLFFTKVAENGRKTSKNPLKSSLKQIHSQNEVWTFFHFDFSNFLAVRMSIYQ